VSWWIRPRIGTGPQQVSGRQSLHQLYAANGTRGVRSKLFAPFCSHLRAPIIMRLQLGEVVPPTD
jgi:hypothetical protein